TTSLRADNKPVERSYLRFNVQGAGSPVSRATLRLFTRDDSTNGPQFAIATDTSWSETGITWNTMPTAGAPFANRGSVASGVWIEIDVTAQVRGNGPITFVMIGDSSNALSVNARESSTNKPQLLVEWGGSGPSPTATTASTVTAT